MKQYLVKGVCLAAFACVSLVPCSGYAFNGLRKDNLKPQLQPQKPNNNINPQPNPKPNPNPKPALQPKQVAFKGVPEANANRANNAKGHSQRSKQHKCRPDTSLAIAKFAEDRRNPIAGKNVLIIGASKGNGNGAAEAFYNAGANVIGTSRAPADYTGQPWLSPVPIDITIDSSVQNFFDTEPTLATWDHIDILVLGGITDSVGTLYQSKASDLFPKLNSELLGRHRVVERAISYMQDIDDSRMITLSSISSWLPLPEVSSYSFTKAALDGWVKQWNVEREWMKQLKGKYVVKTLAMSCQPSFVNTSIGSLPPSFCNPVAPLPYNQYPSGLKNVASQPMFDGQFGYYGNSLVQNLTKEQVGMAILYMATVVNPEWMYVVENGDEQVCTGGKGTSGLSCFLQTLGQHKVRDALTKFIRGNNWNAAFDNILNDNNSKGYSFYICPPTCEKAPRTPVPRLPSGYPDCTSGFIPGVPPNTQKQENVVDLYENPCKPDDPCPE